MGTKSFLFYRVKTLPVHLIPVISQFVRQVNFRKNATRSLKRLCYKPYCHCVCLCIVTPQGQAHFWFWHKCGFKSDSLKSTTEFWLIYYSSSLSPGSHKTSSQSACMEGGLVYRKRSHTSHWRNLKLGNTSFLGTNTIRQVQQGPKGWIKLSLLAI